MYSFLKGLLFLLCALAFMFLVFTLASLSSAKAGEPALHRYWVQYKGREVEVLGYMNRDGKVVWNLGGANDLSRERPIQPAKPASVDAVPAWQTNGVTMSPAQGKSHYTASSPEARKFVAEANGGESAGKLHVTVIGTADERAQVTNDIKTDHAFDGIRDGLWVQDYDPKEWPVDPGLGFLPGKPSIIVQAGKGPSDPKGGRVLHRALDYKEGPQGLAEAIRKADPNYKPELDPMPGKPKLPALPSLPEISEQEWTLLALGVLGALFLLPGKKDPGIDP